MGRDALKMNIVVVGAGLGGLSTAISCAEAGHRVMILEAAKQLGEVGAGLQITPNASKILFRWGLEQSLKAVASEPVSLSVQRYADGRLLYADQDFNGQMRRKYDSPFVDVHRGDLHSMLLDKARKLNVDVRTNSRVSDIDTIARRLKIAGGEYISYDICIGGDGLWSKCREVLLGSQDRPLPTGDLAYRIVIRADEIVDRDLREMVTTPMCRFWVGPDAHIVAYSMRRNTMYNVVLLRPDDLPPEVSRQSGSVEEMRERFQEWDPILSRLLDHVKCVDKWKLMHRAELDRWINDDGRLALVGDACHPMLPYLAQGANSAIEDGAVLGRCLSNMSSEEDILKRVRLYERLRKPRSEAIARETFEQRAAFHLHDGEEQRRRDETMSLFARHDAAAPFPSRWSCPVAQPWLYGYDAIKAADEALAAAA